MKKIALFSAPFLLLLFVLIGVLISSDDEKKSSNESDVTTIGLSAEVLAYRPLVEKYCKESGISEYVDYVLAIMMVESGGKGSDVMQASESLGLPVNTLTPEQSIKQGCAYFSQAVAYAKSKECDIWTAVAGYNFGITGYVNYISEKGKVHKIELADSYSKDVVAHSLGNTTGERYSYKDPIAVAYNGGFLYLNGGNFFYADRVKQYLSGSKFDDETVQKIMDEALKYQGYPYVFGGVAPDAFDCSSLTQWCYQTAGINIPRIAQAQYDSMEHVDLKDAKAGDLVFFHSTYPTSDYVTHVGIYVGNNKMYHAGDPIGYTDLTSSYWQQHLIGAGTVSK